MFKVSDIFFRTQPDLYFSTASCSLPGQVLATLGVMLSLYLSNSVPRPPGHKDNLHLDLQRSFPRDISSRQLSPATQPREQGHPEGQGNMRTVNSYAGFTEFDRSPSFLHPDSSLSKRERSGVSAEDILIHEDPRAALLLERAQVKTAQASSLRAPGEDSGINAASCLYRHAHLGSRKDCEWL
ncbi:unnamed protein product [Oncorhynchus mykiss]|uniref:Uncharacterized protein n=1 Tax=Oncorhynchus mykiss TaxID=8022 RepID=A0A060XK56_ONCMY|nr:unnamed protein product [Oncorhynchus mykiss]